MKIVTHEQLARRNRKIATYVFIFTFILLIAGFFLLNYPLFTGEPASNLVLILQVLTLPLAFVLTLFSVRMTNLWARPPRPDHSIQSGLKGLSKQSILYNYYHIPARHILICPQGIFCLTTRWHNGRFSVDNDQWRTHANPLSRFFSRLRMDGVGNPHQDALQQTAYVQKLFKDIAPDVSVHPLIIFVDPTVQIEVGETSIPVLFPDEKRKPNLRDYLRQINRDMPEDKKGKMPLTEEQIAQFEQQTIGETMNVDYTH